VHQKGIKGESLWEERRETKDGEEGKEEEEKREEKKETKRVKQDIGGAAANGI